MTTIARLLQHTEIPTLEQNIDPAPDPAAVPAEAIAVIRYWWQAGPTEWFAANLDFDREFRDEGGYAG